MEKAPEVSLLAPPDTKGITLNKYKTSEGDKDDDLDEDKNEDADFKPGLDFNDMQFDDSYKVCFSSLFSSDIFEINSKIQEDESLLICISGARMSKSRWT